jgi:hypothetical protein
MASSDTGRDPIEREYEYDKIIEPVMPNDWEGHQRIKNYEMFME